MRRISIHNALATVLILIVLHLAGCHWDESDGLVSPKPTPNPSAHRAVTFKVTPQLGFVDAVKATGDWMISNHLCAPKRPVSGTFVEDIVHVDAQVVQQGSSYLVTVMTDQFEDDNCRWKFVGVDVQLFNLGKAVGEAGVNDNDIKKGNGKLTIVCEPSLGASYCVYLEAARNTLLKRPHAGLFSFVIEGI